MSTFTLQPHKVPVTLSEGLTEEEVTNFKPFKTWLQTLTRSLALQTADENHPFHSDPYALHSINVQSHDRFGRRIGFLKLSASVVNSAGERLPGAVFLRGPSVAMLVMLVPDDVGPDSAERYVVMTVQPRIPSGSLSMVELPAGMVDDGTFVGAAAKEIEEELGLEIKEGDLKCLSEMASPVAEQGEGGADGGLPLAMYPSPGGCDEHITIYAHERRVPRSQLEEWGGKITGLRDKGERITLKLVPMRDLWREGSRDAKCLAAVALWEGLRREGKL
ncbi:related to nucleoside diphosphate-sugar hydrolase of the MutT (NUDIX) family [Cephalotrichum gorgonifer]|uniref:Related to nucleoside diphosphate-sugar hydrolase of the MutT (NUDIX) family n=1 Tax=Cephalotrichum gorgonifer TaxID=2041049 RepID=A0AAE8STL3_9PEZI|nr:related to nucleoside diphosphate-sugar hydrolase of the MutT (NUDIX) family [Cephalotrichum gorgonifer]